MWKGWTQGRRRNTQQPMLRVSKPKNNLRRCLSKNTYYRLQQQFGIDSFWGFFLLMCQDVLPPKQLPLFKACSQPNTPEVPPSLKYTMFQGNPCVQTDKRIKTVIPEQNLCPPWLSRTYGIRSEEPPCRPGGITLTADITFALLLGQARWMVSF